MNSTLIHWNPKQRLEDALSEVGDDEFQMIFFNGKQVTFDEIPEQARIDSILTAYSKNYRFDTKGLELGYDSPRISVTRKQSDSPDYC